MDFFAIASYGAYPTPTPTGALRAALGASMGLLNMALPATVFSTTVLNSVLRIGRRVGIGLRMLNIRR